MKKSLIFLIIVFISASCAVSNRIIKMDGPDKESKGFKLIQSPAAYSTSENGTLTGRLKVKVTSTYFFEERGKEHPVITVSFRISPSSRTLDTDAELSYNINGEIIKVGSKIQLKVGQFIIPENLWVSLVHSQKLNFSLKGTKEVIDFELDESEKNKLSEFFKRSIDRRDLLFPEIPEGKKKW